MLGTIITVSIINFLLVLLLIYFKNVLIQNVTTDEEIKDYIISLRADCAKRVQGKTDEELIKAYRNIEYLGAFLLDCLIIGLMFTLVFFIRML